MKPLPTRTWSTPLVIGASAVMAFSGVMLFFHLGEELLKTPHEWVGMVFVAGMLLHVLNHLTVFTRYFSQPLAQGVMAACLVLALGIGGANLLGSQGGEGGHPGKRMIGVVENAPLSTVAELNKLEVAELLIRFNEAGISQATADSSLKELAQSSGKNTFALMAIVLAN